MTDDALFMNGVKLSKTTKTPMLAGGLGTIGTIWKKKSEKMQSILTTDET